MSRTALLAGATGLVGSHVLEQLLADDTWSRVITVGRRATPLRHDKLEQRVVDLGALEAQGDLPRADDVFCCLGTTIRQAGSQAAFRRVDYEFVLALARTGIRIGATQFLLVSAIGASARSRFFYNRVKGELEDALRSLGFRSVTIVRPSLLLGDRAEFRLGESLAKRMGWILPGKYRPVQAADVAAALVRSAKVDEPGLHIIESDDIRSAYLSGS